MSPRRISLLMVAFSAWMFIAAVWSLMMTKVLLSASAVRVAQSSDIRNGIARIDDIETLRKICLAVLDSSHATEQVSWLLLSWGVGFVLVCSAVFGITAYCLQRQLGVVEAATSASGAARLFDAAFAGKLESWKAFWGGYVFLPFLAMIVIGGSWFLMKSHGLIEKTGVVETLGTPLVASAISVIYLAGAIAAWRCASNARLVWKYLARAAILFFTVLPLGRSLGIISWVLTRY